MEVDQQEQGLGQVFCVRDAHGVPEPSRPKGHRCIDYFVAVNLEVGQLVYRDETISDHHAVVAQVMGLVVCGAASQDSWRAKPTTRYNRPPEFEAATWTELQSQVWKDAQVPTDAGDHQQVTEDEWRWLCDTAEAAMRYAASCSGSLADPPCRRRKGSLLETHQVGQRETQMVKKGTFALRRLLKLQGRIREMQRQSAQGREVTGLARDIEKTWPQSLGPFPGCEGSEELLSSVDVAIQQLHESQTRQTVHKWQQSIAKGGRQATAWLRGKQRALSYVTPHDERSEARRAVSVNDSLRNIRRFWTTIWNRPGIDRLRAVQKWITHGKRCSFRGRLAHILTAGNMAKAAAAKAGSTAGIDGWSGDEVSTWPEAAWAAFATLALRWFKRGRFPQVWSQSRQIHLPKEEPHLAAGAMRADQMRPITVLSILWRIIGSCVVSHQSVQTWCSEIVHESQAGGLRSRHLFHGLATIAEPFQDGHAVGALDYQKCFDYVAPSVACDILAEAGLPKDLVQALRVIWDQTRFIELGDSVLPEGVRVSESMPQGDAISPLALHVLLSAPSRAVGEHFGADYRQSVFLDDRVIACQPHRMPEALEQWEQWSRDLGLHENRRKQAFVCKSVAGRQTLRDVGLGPWVRDSIRVLGVDLQVEPDADTPVADARAQEALARGSKLVNRAVPLTVRRELWRTRIVPKASWGHIFRPFAEHWTKSFADLFRQVTFSHRIGSQPLRMLLEGHVMDCDFVAGMQCVRAWRSSDRAPQLARQVTRGTWFGCIIRFLASHGWRHEAHAIFTTAGQRLDLQAERTDAADHKMRVQWKRMLFQKFCDANRRDSHALAGWVFNERQVDGARRLYKESAQDGRAVLVGAALSTAFYRKQHHDVELRGCVHCGQSVVPSWEHLVWECPGVPNAAERPTRPVTAAAARLGWPMLGESFASASARLRWMGSIRELVRERRGSA